ncbi:GNAT family N-acetyltransferase [Salinibius halmophilus]|uniref:GNAT family N-acetyltransferase n=1 Tax=Salinibius halmophilus TaxID=1853216 RepID=UPI00131423B1|nr:GNAT family N-acetyltransferase [Salinibius halmophilus]
MPVSAFNFIRRLIVDFDSGNNRFDQQGEALFVVLDGRRLVAIGGVNIDPFESASGVGRVRRVYVLPEYRGSGVGRLLMDAIETHAAQHFSQLNLYTDTVDAALFYQRLGYAAVSLAGVSHQKRLMEPVT